MVKLGAAHIFQSLTNLRLIITLLYDVSHLLEVLIRDGTDLGYLVRYVYLNFILISCG